MNNKIKVLAIAPYHGLKDLIQDAANERKDIEVDTFVADMLDGVKIVKSIQEKEYDAIISRAGTADLIKEVTDLPVIDIKLSIIDMMRAIKLAQNYSGKFVIVGFKGITDTANTICLLNKIDVEIKTISDIDEIDDCLTDLKEMGVSLIIGDVITINHAKMIGLNTVLVTSGRESVLSSFDEVIKLNKFLLNTEQKSLVIKNILKNSNMSVFCFDIDGKIIFENISNDVGIYEEILGELKGLVDVLLKENKFKIIKRIGNSLVKIKGEILRFNGFVYLTFYLKNQKSTIKPVDKAISYKNISDTPKYSFETLSTSNGFFKNVIEDAKAYSITQTPVILFGDKGTGKDTFAHAMYHNSHLNKNPFVTIDSKYMNEKKWVYLFESEDSLFTNSDITIYIKNLHHMDKEIQDLFESYFLNTYVHKRNRFIFSCINGYSKTFDTSSLLSFIRYELAALPLTLPNLNERKDDIPSLASLFLSDLILKYGKQVIGLDTDALRQLQEFNWTDNINQFQRIMEELIILSDSFYINAETVTKVLSYESLPKLDTYSHSLDLNKSLDEINKEIIDLILIEENHNQSRVAERLGISRSTLWRKIK